MKRQLNLYGFKYMHRGDNKGCFYNPQFRRGNFESAKSIVRYSAHKRKAAAAAAAASSTSSKMTAPVYSTSIKPTNSLPMDTDSMSDGETFNPYNKPLGSSTRSSTSKNRPKVETIQPEHIQVPGSIEPCTEILAPAIQLPVMPPFAPYGEESIFRPSVLTSRIGFSSTMMHPTISRPDRDSLLRPTGNPRVTSIDEIAALASNNSYNSFNNNNSLSDAQERKSVGMTRNGMSIDDLLQFLATENQYCDKGEIPCAFNLW